MARGRKRGRRRETAVEFARRSFSELAPRSASELIRKVREQTERRLGWPTAKTIFEELSGRRVARRRGGRRAAATTVGGETFLVVVARRGKRQEIVEYADRSAAGKMAVRLMGRGKPVRVLRAMPASVQVQVS